MLHSFLRTQSEATISVGAMFQASRLEETWHHPYGEAWWWQRHVVGMFFSGRGWETSQDRGKDEWNKVQKKKNLLQSAQDRRLGKRFTFQQDNDPQPRQCRNVLEWPSQSPDLNPIEHLWRDLKIAVQRHSQFNLTELERICRENFEKLPKYTVGLKSI